MGRLNPYAVIANTTTNCSNLSAPRQAAANDHEANGLVDNGNRTFRSFFHHLRLCDKRNTTEFLDSGAVFGNTISVG